MSQTQLQLPERSAVDHPTANCTQVTVIEGTWLSDGSLLSEGDLKANAYVDQAAKNAAIADHLPLTKRLAVQQMSKT